MKAAIVQQAMPGVTGNQDYTDAVFSSDIQGALCFFTRATASDTITEEGMISVGAVDSGANQGAFSVHSADNIGTATDYRVELSTTEVALLTNAVANNSIAEGVASILTNGIRINWTDVNANELISVLLLGGADVVVSVRNVTLNGTTDVNVNHGLGGTPTAIIGLCTANAASASSSSNITIGFYDVAANAYRALTSRHANANSTSQVSQKWVVGSLVCEHDNATETWAATINDVGATTFDIVASAATTDVVTLICIRLVGGVVQVGDFTTRTTVGTASDITGMSKKPKVVFYLTSFLTAGTGSGNIVASGSCESFGLGIAVDNEGVTEQAAVSWWEDDGVVLGTTDTKSLTSGNKAGLSFDNSGTLGYAWDISSWNSDGVTHNYTTTEATARRVVYLALAPAVAAPPGTPTLMGQIVM